MGFQLSALPLATSTIAPLACHHSSTRWLMLATWPLYPPHDAGHLRRSRATHALVAHITGLSARPGCRVHYSAGFDLDERVRAVLPRLPQTAWTPALDADGTARPDAQVAELTGLLRHSAGGDRLAGWPADMRILIRRENPHPGAQLSLFEQDEGKRYQVTVTNTPRGQVQFLEGRHRSQASTGLEDHNQPGRTAGQRRHTGE